MKLDLHSPVNRMSVRLNFKKAKSARVIGALGDQEGQLEEGKRVSGLLIKQDFNYTLVNPKD